MPNENCLAGFKCPQCGNEDKFGIACDVVYEFTDDGSDKLLSDGLEWDNDSYCECRNCLKAGVVKDFIMEEDPAEAGLDEAVRWAVNGPDASDDPVADEVMDYRLRVMKDGRIIYQYGPRNGEWGCRFDLLSEVGEPYLPWFIRQMEQMTIVKETRELPDGGIADFMVGIDMIECVIE